MASFLNNATPSNVDNVSSPHAAGINVFSHVLRSETSRAQVIKPESTAEPIDPGVDAELTLSYCTQNPNVSRFKWDFRPVENGYKNTLHL